MLIANILGWLGAVFLLLAYWLVSNKKIDAASPRYQGLNIAGGGALIVNSGYYGAYPSVAVNVVWIIVGVLALMRFARPESME